MTLTQMLLPKHRRVLVGVTIAYWALIFTLTHLPGPLVPPIGVSDKVAHFLAYGGLGGVLFITLWASRPAWPQLGIVVLAIGMAYGAIDELLQAIPFVHRDCSLLDWMADAAGLAVSVVGMTLVRSRAQVRATQRAVAVEAVGD